MKAGAGPLQDFRSSHLRASRPHLNGNDNDSSLDGSLVSRDGSIISNLKDMLGSTNQRGGGLPRPESAARPSSQGRPPLGAPPLFVSADDLLINSSSTDSSIIPGQIITPQPGAQVPTIFKGSISQMQQSSEAPMPFSTNRPGHDSAGSTGMAPTTAHVEQQGAWDGFVNSEFACLCSSKPGRRKSM